MSITTHELLSPLLVSDLPPVQVPSRSVFSGVREALAARRVVRSFERALRQAGHAEQNDLIALSRRG